MSSFCCDAGIFTYSEEDPEYGLLSFIIDEAESRGYHVKVPNILYKFTPGDEFCCDIADAVYFLRGKLDSIGSIYLANKLPLLPITYKRNQ